jgi:hypothetical protein
MGASGYQDAWYAQQCGGCANYVPLTGPLGDDWGACRSPLSPMDARLVFEHVGCGAFVPDTSGTAPFQ